MKDRRKKIFLMSMLSFLIISSIIYVFLIISAVDDIKGRSYMLSAYSAKQRALLPIFKYLGMVDTSHAISSLAKSLVPEDFKKVGEIFSSSSSQLPVNESSAGVGSSDYAGGKGSGKSRFYGQGGVKHFIPSSKLSSDINMGFSGGSEGSNTSQSKSSLSGEFSSSAGTKKINISKNTFSSTDSQSQTNRNNLVARLNYTKSSLASAMKSNSADSARFNWERGFSGSVKPDGSMFYKGNAIEIDKIKSGVENLKFEEVDGLHEPQVPSPKIDSNTSPDKAKEMINNLLQDMAKSMINPLANAFGGGIGSVKGDSRQNSIIADDPAASNLSKADEEKIKSEVEKWKFYSDEKVVTTYLSCEVAICDKLGIKGNGVYQAYFPDGFVLTLNTDGKVIGHYYSVAPEHEAAFLENYQKYCVGSK